jgi:GntR family transcriptional regulator, transcriptional repressor for pyruvate dehydrogenase complex
MTASPQAEQPAKASETIANELREKMLSGQFAEGTSLPPERELVARHGVSRTTVREALRVLEAQGFIRIKTGRAGGAFVRKPGEESVENSVTLLIRGSHIRLIDLLETREAVEPQCARLAARYCTPEDLATIESADEAMSDATTLDAYLNANINWHVGVARATHNQLLIGFMVAISRAILAATANEGFVNQEVRRDTNEAHRSVTQAIRNGDGDAAERRMYGHVHTYKQLVLEVEERTAIRVD